LQIFPGNCFNKLLKLYQTESRMSSNLLKRKQSSRKTSIVCRWLKTRTNSRMRKSAAYIFYH